MKDLLMVILLVRGRGRTPTQSNLTAQLVSGNLASPPRAAVHQGLTSLDWRPCLKWMHRPGRLPVVMAVV